RNTRSTLRGYYERGLIDAPPPRRRIDDEVFDFADTEERDVYDSVTTYIDKRFDELEQDRPGRGFVMTVYRRRATSSLSSLRKSLERRRDGLARIVGRQAYSDSLEGDDDLDPGELGDLGENASLQKISAAYPSDPKAAARELEEVKEHLYRI